MTAQKSVKTALDGILRKIKAAENALAGELEKGGNVPFAYTELASARQAIERIVRELP